MKDKEVEQVDDTELSTTNYLFILIHVMLFSLSV